MGLWHLLERAVHRWDAVQVDLNGHYSVARFAEFTAYAQQTSRRRLVSQLVLTPLPPVLFLILLDSLPLEPPSAKSLASPRYWTRCYIVALLVTVGLLEQLRYHIPGLLLTTRFTVAVAWAAATVSVASVMLVTELIGHPLPFSMLHGSGPWVAILVGSVYWRTRRVLHAQPALQEYLIGYALYSQLRFSLTIVYAAYMFVFTSLEGAATQTAFVIVLSLIKFVAKQLMARCLRDLDDLKPEALILNVEVFHALFVAYSMQNATSMATAVVLMAVDVVHAWLMLMDVNRLIAELHGHRQQLLERDNATLLSPMELDVLAVAATILERNPHVSGSSSIRLTTYTQLGRKASFGGPRQAARPLAVKNVMVSVAPTSETVQTRVHATEPLTLVRKTLQLLYVTEFVVLIEYVEIIVPFIFNVYMVAMFYLPNRAYYPLLNDMSDAKLRDSVLNVALYALLEVVSFVVISVILWRKLRLSIVHQLAFVLDQHWVIVQSTLAAWVVYVVQSSLEHNGFDYTFRFAWLRHQNATPSS